MLFFRHYSIFIRINSFLIIWKNNLWYKILDFVKDKSEMGIAEAQTINDIVLHQQAYC